MDSLVDRILELESIDKIDCMIKRSWHGCVRVGPISRSRSSSALGYRLGLIIDAWPWYTGLYENSRVITSKYKAYSRLSVTCLLRVESKRRRVDILMELRLRSVLYHLPYGAVLIATWHEWTYPDLTPVRWPVLNYLLQRDERLRCPKCLVTYQDGLSTHRWSPIQVLTQQCMAGVDLTTCWSQVQLPNHYTTMSPKWTVVIDDVQDSEAATTAGGLWGRLAVHV